MVREHWWKPQSIFCGYSTEASWTISTNGLLTSWYVWWKATMRSDYGLSLSSKRSHKTRIIWLGSSRESTYNDCYRSHRNVAPSSWLPCYLIRRVLNECTKSNKRSYFMSWNVGEMKKVLSTSRRLKRWCAMPWSLSRTRRINLSLNSHYSSTTQRTLWQPSNSFIRCPGSCMSISNAMTTMEQSHWLSPSNNTRTRSLRFVANPTTQANH